MFQDDKYSWRKGATTANNDMIIWKWNKEEWIQLKIIRSFETSLSDHKAFKIQFWVREEVIPIGRNDRWLIDNKDRMAKNLLLVEQLCNMRVTEDPLIVF